MRRGAEFFRDLDLCYPSAQSEGVIREMSGSLVHSAGIRSLVHLSH